MTEYDDTLNLAPRRARGGVQPTHAEEAAAVVAGDAVGDLVGVRVGGVPMGRRSLAAVLGLGVMAGFVWLWWKDVPALYQDSGAGLDARAQAVTGTRTGLLIALAGASAIGALWGSVAFCETYLKVCVVMSIVVF